MNIALFGRRSAVESKRIRLVKDLKIVAADTDQLLQEVATATGAEFAAARVRMEERLGKAKSRLDAARKSLTKEGCAVTELGHRYVAANPWQILGVATAVVATALLVTRR